MIITNLNINSLFLNGREIKILIDTKSNNIIYEKILNYYYENLNTLIQDIINNEIGKNAKSEQSNFSINNDKNNLSILCNNNITEFDNVITLTNLSNITIDFQNNSISGTNKLFEISSCSNITIQNYNFDFNSDNQDNLINIENSDNIIFNNGQFNFTTDGTLISTQPMAAINIISSNVSMIETSSFVQDKEQNKAVTVLSVDTNSQTNIISSDIHAVSKLGYSYGIYSFGQLNIDNSSISADSDHTANANGDNYASTSRGIYSENDLSIKNSYVYGTHSGITTKGENLYIDGGTYESYSHGGVYVSNGLNRIYNATIKACDLHDGYLDGNEAGENKAGTNEAGLYIGGGQNISVFVDNCDISGNIQPIVLRESSSEINNNLYISNSRINSNCASYSYINQNGNKINSYPIIGNYGELSNIIVGIYNSGIRNKNSKNIIYFGENCGIANISSISDDDVINNFVPARPNYIRVYSETGTMASYSFEVTDEKYVI